MGGDNGKLTVAVPGAEWFRDNVPCQAACPAHTDVSGYVGLISEGRFDEAYALNLQANLFPDILGRICSRPCESACRLGRLGEPVSICYLKRAASDFRTKKAELIAPRTRRPESIGIIGVGPAGMAAANDLALRGYAVTIYEALPDPGGMLVVGIPAYRLPREVVMDAARKLERLGVTFRMNCAVGRDIQLDELQRRHNAVLIAAGAHKPQKLEIPGEELDRVLHGVTFMRRVNTEAGFHVTDRRVAVVGGGHTAIDCVRSAVRLGAEKVYMLYRRSEAEITVTREELEEAIEEGVEPMFLVSPVEVQSDGRGGVGGLLCIRNELGQPDATGRRRPVPIQGSEFTLDVDMLIPAVSQAPDIDFLPGEAGLELSRWDRLVVDPSTFMSNVVGLFACGDFITGPRNVIDVIAEARRAANRIHRYLGGEVESNRHAELVRIGPPFAREEGYDAIPRQRMPTRPVEQRARLDAEVEFGYSRERAIYEAKRCLQCQLNIAIDGGRCILCAGCVDVCPQRVLRMLPFTAIESEDGLQDLLAEEDASPAGSMVLTLDEERCIRCGLCILRCQTKAISMTRFEHLDSDERWFTARWENGATVRRGEYR